MSPNTLQELLEAWDGTHTDYLIQVYLENGESEDFFQALLDLYAGKPDLQVASTWLIKHHYDKGRTLPERLETSLIFTAKELNAWEAKLHLLQLLPKFSLHPNHIPYLEDFVRACLEEEKTFVRAWAYQGFYEVAQHKPELFPELKQLCAQALESEKASVKARVRKIVGKIP